MTAERDAVRLHKSRSCDDERSLLKQLLLQLFVVAVAAAETVIQVQWRLSTAADDATHLTDCVSTSRTQLLFNEYSVKIYLPPSQWCWFQ